MLRRRGVRRAPHLFGFSQPLGDECALWCAGWHRERCWAPTLGSWSALQTAFASGPPPPPTPPVTNPHLQGGGSEYAFNLGQGVALDPVTCQSGRRAMSHVCAPTNPQPSAPPPPGLNRLAGACSTTSTSRGAANDATLASSLTSKASACTSRRWRCAIAHARCSQSVVWQSLTASCIAGRGRWRRASHQLWQRAAARQAGAGASTRPTRAHTASVVAVSNGPLTRAIRTPTSARSARAHRRRVLGARVRKS